MSRLSDDTVLAKFQQIDSNGDGYINITELGLGMTRTWDDSGRLGLGTLQTRDDTDSGQL